MRVRGKLRGSAALTACIAFAAAFSQPATASGSEQPVEPIALFGPVPTEATSVEIVALPRLDELGIGEVARSLYLKEAVVEVQDGQYEAFIEPAAIPASYVGDGGLVDFEIVASSASTTWVTGATSRIIERIGIDGDRESFWADPGANTEVLLDENAKFLRGHPRIMLGTTTTSAGELAPAPEYEVEIEDDGTQSSNDFVAEREYNALSGCTIRNTGEQTVRSTTIGTSYPAGETRGRMSVSGSDGAKYGIGVNVEGDGEGFSASGSSFTQSGWSFTWAWEGANRSFRKGIEYVKFRVACGVPGAVVRRDSWRPVGETGGTGNNWGLPAPNWGHCQAVPEGVWSRDSSSGSAYSYGTAVKFASMIGIDLGISREYTISQKLQYDIPNANYKLCGSNDWPGSASKIQTKRRS